MSNIVDVSLFFNAIPEQRLTYANQLTIASWNDTINTIRVQLNALTQYLKQFDYLFFDETNPYNWYSTVIQNNTVPVGEVTDSKDTISYYGLKNRIDTKSSIYIGDTAPENLNDIWFDTN